MAEQYPGEQGRLGVHALVRAVQAELRAFGEHGKLAQFVRERGPEGAPGFRAFAGSGRRAGAERQAQLDGAFSTLDDAKAYFKAKFAR